MARQKLMVGTYGDINCTKRANGTWLARARYCDVDGVVREYRKSGETKNKARANLKAFFVDHTGTFGDGAIAPDDTVQQLLDHGDVIKRITIAPELPGALEAIANFQENGVTVSGGHSDGP